MPSAVGADGFALVAETIDGLFQQALQVGGFKQFRTIVDQMCSLRRHKPWNAFLITAQRPGALAVATPKEWLGRYQRSILPGARPIVILHPFGPVRFVFELGDTTGPELPNLKIADPFDVTVKPNCVINNDVLLHLPREFREADRILVQRDDYGFNLAGRASRASGTLDGETMVGSNEHTTFVVRVSRRLGPAEAFATLAHELGHIYCGHLGTPVPSIRQGRKKRHYWPNRSQDLTKAQREFEAEATCYVVCQRLGISPKSAEYLSGYIAAEDWPHISLTNIIRAVHRIEFLSAPVLKKFGTERRGAEVEALEMLPLFQRTLEDHDLS